MSELFFKDGYIYEGNGITLSLDKDGQVWLDGNEVICDLNEFVTTTKEGK